MSSSSTLLSLFLLLGCIGIATAAATEPKTENNFATSSIRLWPRWWWPSHPTLPSPPTPSPSPYAIDNAASPHGSVLGTDPDSNYFLHQGGQLCIRFGHFCFQAVHALKEGTIFLGKVRNYCSHAVDNAIPSPSPVDNAASPPHASPSTVVNVDSLTNASPSPSPVDNVASPTHVAPSLVDNVVSPTHAAPTPSLPDNVAPTPSLADNVAPPTHAVPSPSPVDDVVIHRTWIPLGVQPLLPSKWTIVHSI